MENAAALKQALGDLFAHQSLGVLSTYGRNQPYASLIAFVASDDLRHIFFATSRATRKYANLQALAQAAILIDNRSNQVADFHRAMAVTATGTTRELSGHERSAALERYLARHPHLAEFAASPSCALLRLTVECYYAVNRFQNVVELHIDHELDSDI